MRLALASLVLALPAWAQGGVVDDPYTRGEPAAMQRAGYVSFGPFAFGDGHDTRAVEAALGIGKLRWVETAHFKLGSALREMKLPSDRDERAKLRAELGRLVNKLDGVDPQTRLVDPWLRLHLFALRLEELYEDFCQRMDIDASFRGSYLDSVPPARDETALGPFLGQRGKYTVLLLETVASFGRYETTFMGSATGAPRRHHYLVEGSLFYGDAMEFGEPEYRSDLAFHCGVVHSVVQNLASGYRSYSHDLPTWFCEGLGHWYARQIDPRFPVYSLGAKHMTVTDGEWKWEERVRARASLGNFPKWQELFVLDLSRLDRKDHAFLWSRVDYLMDQGRAGLLLEALKRPLVGTTLLERQQLAFTTIWGKSFPELDRDWVAWVLENYR